MYVCMRSRPTWSTPHMFPVQRKGYPRYMWAFQQVYQKHIYGTSMWIYHINTYVHWYIYMYLQYTYIYIYYTHVYTHITHNYTVYIYIHRWNTVLQFISPPAPAKEKIALFFIDFAGYPSVCGLHLPRRPWRFFEDGATGLRSAGWLVVSIILD